MTSSQFSGQWGGEGLRESQEIKYSEDKKPPKAQPPTSFQLDESEHIPQTVAGSHPDDQVPQWPAEPNTITVEGGGVEIAPNYIPPPPPTDPDEDGK